MTNDPIQALLIISIFVAALAILSPILWWILPDRSHSV